MRKFIFLIVFLFIFFSVYAQELIKIANGYIESIVNGNYEKAYALQSEKLKKILPTDKLKQIWETILRNYGNLREVSFVSIEENEKDGKKYKTILYKLIFEKQVLVSTVTLSMNGKVEGFYIMPYKKQKEEIYKTPDYVDKSSFTEVEISFRTDYEIKGTLSIPKRKGPFIAIVLVHGSGPQDRDETIGPNKPFRDIAWGLATKGYMVLRYDKRTKTYRKEMLEKVLKNEKSCITIEDEVIEDAVKAVEFLRKRGDVRKIVILGHSLGGMLGPFIVEKAKADALIMLAPPARNLIDLVQDQIIYLRKMNKINEEMMKKTIYILNKLKNHEVHPKQLVLGAFACYYYDLEKYDQLKKLKELSIPILILQGLKDYKVTTKDLSLWRKVTNGMDNVCIVTFDNLGHFFMNVKDDPFVESYVTLHVDANVVKYISNWLKNIFH